MWLLAIALSSAFTPGTQLRPRVSSPRAQGLTMCADEEPDPDDRSRAIAMRRAMETAINAQRAAAAQAADAEVLEESNPQDYQVYLLNDNFNMREYVQRVLMLVCSISESDAMDIMMRANWGGGSLIGSYEEELAEHVYKGLIKANLRAEIRPGGDGESDRSDDDSPDSDARFLRRLLG